MFELLSFIFNVPQVLKAAMGHGQLLLDFLCQPGAQMVVAENQTVRSERTTFAEKLGSFRLRWLQLERELESQVIINPNDATVTSVCKMFIKTRLSQQIILMQESVYLK